MNNPMLEMCKHCGCTFGSHHAGTSSWPRDYCPGHEGKMDWARGLEQSLDLLEYIRKIRRKKMVSERTLKRWRKEALEIHTYLKSIDHNQVKINPMETMLLKTSDYVLRMTQELLDLHLIRK